MIENAIKNATAQIDMLLNNTQVANLVNSTVQDLGDAFGFDTSGIDAFLSVQNKTELLESVA